MKYICVVMTSILIVSSSLECAEWASPAVHITKKTAQSPSSGPGVLKTSAIISLGLASLIGAEEVFRYASQHHTVQAAPVLTSPAAALSTTQVLLSCAVAQPNTSVIPSAPEAPANALLLCPTASYSTAFSLIDHRSLPTHHSLDRRHEESRVQTRIKEHTMYMKYGPRYEAVLAYHYATRSKLHTLPKKNAGARLHR